MRLIAPSVCSLLALVMAGCSSAGRDSEPQYAMMSWRGDRPAGIPVSAPRMMGGEPVPIWVSSWATQADSTIQVYVQLDGPARQDMEVPIQFAMTSDDSGTPGDYIKGPESVVVKFQKDQVWGSAPVMIKDFKGARKTILMIAPGSNANFKMHAVGTLFLQDEEIKPPAAARAAP
jgi:hypothetical protein